MKKYLEKVNLNESHKRVKIDIGLSYNAPHSQIWLDHDKDLVVFGFEPNPENINSLSSGNIIKKHPSHGEPLKNEYLNSRFFLIPVALGNVNEVETLDFYCMERDSGTSSILKPDTQQLGAIKEIVQVPVYSLKHFFDVFPWDKYEYIEYIKIDAQGYDLNILKGAQHYLKEKVVYITAEPECSTYNGSDNNTFENITKYLESQNFIRITHENTHDPTFINKKFLHLKDKIFIYQNG
jgi:FkbM family methyltransferase